MIEKKIKILHIIGCLRLGGAETLLYNFINSSDKSRFEHEVAVIQPMGYYWDNKLFQKMGIKVHVVDFGEKHEQNYFGAFKMLKLVLKEKPDIIHFHNKVAHLWIFPLIKVVSFLLGSKIRCINTIHDTHQYKNPWKRILFEKFANPFIDNQVAISEGVSKYHCEKFKTKKEKFLVIRNGVPIHKFKKSFFKENVENIVSVANLFPEKKGYETAIEAIKILVKEFPKIKYNIVGEGPLRSYIESFIKKNDLQENIILHGSCNNVPEILSKMDIFLLPSHWEGFGLVNIEAMAAGLPVIGTNVGGVSEILDDGKYGILIKAGEPSEIVKAIKLLILNIERRKEFVELGNLRAKDYDLSFMTRNYESLYESLVK